MRDILDLRWSAAKMLLFAVLGAFVSCSDADDLVFPKHDIVYVDFEGAEPQYVASDTIRLLAIGNSFAEDAVSDYLRNLFRSDYHTVKIAWLMVEGSSLGHHVESIKADKAEYRYYVIDYDGSQEQFNDARISEVIASERWDLVTVQQSSSQSGDYQSYAIALPQLLQYIRANAPRAKIALHQTWAYAPHYKSDSFAKYDNDQQTMYTAICEATSQAMAEHDIDFIIPAGTAIQNARATELGNDLTRDGIHLDRTVGRYTAACTWYTAITHKDVRATVYNPSTVGLAEREIARRSAHNALRNPYRISQ